MKPERRTSPVRQVELVDAALHIIATQGIANLSTRSLADQVGLSTGAIFRHFASIDALLDAVVTRVEGVLEASYPADDLPPLERLMRFVETRSSAVGTQVGILRLVLSEQFMLALPRRGSARLSRCVHKSRVFVFTALAEGQARGEVRADVEAGALALIVMGTIQMLALSAANSVQGVPAAQLVRAGLATLLGAPRPTPPKRRTRRSP